MVHIAWHMIWKDKTRFFITVGGVALTVLLMLFLLGVYDGVKKGALSYVINCPADFWVCSKNSTNLLRSSSFLPETLQHDLSRTAGIESSAAVVRFIARANIRSKAVTLVLFGFDPSSNLSRPVTIIQGTNAIRPGEIILDRAFASEYGLAVGESLDIQGYIFRVAGITEETNAVVAQFAFTTIDDAQSLLGLPGIMSYYLLKKREGEDSQALLDSLKGRFPSLAIYRKQEFVENNLEEMKKGILPILWTIALLGAVVGTSVIMLMLYSSVLEKRDAYALLKALGAGQPFLVFLVMRQSMAGTLIGLMLGSGLNTLTSPLLMKLVPAISLSFTWHAAAAVFCLSIVIGAAASLIPICKLSRVYPAEVFRA